MTREYEAENPEEAAEDISYLYFPQADDDYRYESENDK